MDLSASPVVLVVEDDIINQKLLAEVCKAEGYAVLTAGDGEQALEVFAAHHVDLVLLDATMPRKDGFAVCEEIRSRTSVPVIMVTACVESGVEERAKTAGVTVFVSKPFRIYELTRHLRAVLGANRSPSEPPTAIRRARRREAATLARLTGMGELRRRLRQESDHAGAERACVAVRIQNAAQICRSEGRHATDAALGAVGAALIQTLGEGNVFWSDHNELIGVMSSNHLDATLATSLLAPEPLHDMKLEVVLRLGAVRYRPESNTNVDELLKQVRLAAEQASNSSESMVIRDLSRTRPDSSG